MPRLGMKMNEGGRRNHLIEILSHVLNELCNQLYPSNINGNTCSCFNSLQPPPIKLECYLKRIATFSGCSDESLIFSLIYIDRLITNKDRRFLVTTLNVHRLILASVLVAVKFYDDQYFNNVFFSKVGGVLSKELNVLETEFLFLINFNLFVDIKLYARYNKRLMSCAAPISGPAVEERPSLPLVGVPRPFAHRSIPSLPLYNRNIQPKMKPVAAYHPERSSTKAASNSLSSDEPHIRSQVHRSGSNSRNYPKSPVESNSSVQRRCSDVALFLRPHEISQQNKVLPSH